MSYQDRFALADDFLNHVDGLMEGIDDPFIRFRYLGFIAVSAVTAYELAIKDVIYRFSEEKHRALGELARAKFSRLNGRISLRDLRPGQIECFGKKYCVRFDRLLDAAEDDAKLAHEPSIRSSYGNLISWRHKFVHEGEAPVNATYGELRGAYQQGKKVIVCMNSAMKR